MKKLLAVFLLLIAGTASAQHFHHHHGYWQRGYNGGWNWVAPTIIGGVIGYEIARNQTPVVVQQQPVIVQQQQSGCTSWREVQSSDGTIYRERTCYGVQQ